MKLEKFVRKNFEVLAVELSCHVERGMFPQYNWFLNNTRLESQGPFHRTFHANNSGLMVKLDPHNTNGGVYHCKVFNSFDSTTGVSSPVTLISHEGNRAFTIWCTINTRIKCKGVFTTN